MMRRRLFTGIPIFESVFCLLVLLSVALAIATYVVRLILS